MNEKYKAWIEANVADDGYGKCRSVTMDMAEAFPELRRARGHFLDTHWGRRPHWWLVTAEGAIVDPTGTQFPAGENFPASSERYVELPEGSPEPTGKCYNCGAYTWRGNSFCSAECYEDTREAPEERGGFPSLPPLRGDEIWTEEEQCGHCQTS